jgi:hypothetical protein
MTLLNKRAKDKFDPLLVLFSVFLSIFLIFSLVPGIRIYSFFGLILWLIYFLFKCPKYKVKSLIFLLFYTMYVLVWSINIEAVMHYLTPAFILFLVQSSNVKEKFPVFFVTFLFITLFLQAIFQYYISSNFFGLIDVNRVLDVSSTSFKVFGLVGSPQNFSILVALSSLYLLSLKKLSFVQIFLVLFALFILGILSKSVLIGAAFIFGLLLTFGLTLILPLAFIALNLSFFSFNNTTFEFISFYDVLNIEKRLFFAYPDSILFGEGLGSGSYFYLSDSDSSTLTGFESSLSIIFYEAGIVGVLAFCIYLLHPFLHVKKINFSNFLLILFMLLLFFYVPTILNWKVLSFLVLLYLFKFSKKWTS